MFSPVPVSRAAVHKPVTVRVMWRMKFDIVVTILSDPRLNDLYGSSWALCLLYDVNDTTPVSHSLLVRGHLGSNVHLIVVENPGFDSLRLKQDVQLLECPSFGFRKTEPDPYAAKQAETTCEETGLAPPVAFGGVEDIRRNNIVDDRSDVVSVACQANGFGTQPS